MTTSPPFQDIKFFKTSIVVRATSSTLTSNQKCPCRFVLMEILGYEADDERRKLTFWQVVGVRVLGFLMMDPLPHE